MLSTLYLRAGSVTVKAIKARAIPHTTHQLRCLSASESFLSGTSSVYVEQMYEAWQKDPSSVHKSWDAYFRNVNAGAPIGQAVSTPPSISSLPSFTGFSVPSQSTSPDSVKINLLIRAFQVRGFEVANLDPLGLVKKPDIPELKPQSVGFTDADLDRVFPILNEGPSSCLRVFGESLTLRDIIKHLEEIYCDTIGIEYMHINSREECNWIRDKLEKIRPEHPPEKKKHILERLTYADGFERYLATKYNTAKRFGLEGAESVIPGMKAMIDRSVNLGVESIVMGMPHRGRLNVLGNVVRKPLEQIFQEFQGLNFDQDQWKNENDFSFSGDVKYHLGTSFKRRYPDGKTIHLSLVANPSHLEAVNPVVEGKTRAKQFYMGDDTFSKVMPVLLHGDAAFAGQGIVYETIGLSQLENYKTGGTIHVIVNNQIGFTTDPYNSRSSSFCSDIGKAFQIPIFHVNGDDPEAVVHVFEVASEWRQKFKRDCIIDLVCYRRHGHNELDQPLFTQPLMYKKIAKQPSTLDIYTEKLLRTNVVTPEHVKNLKDHVNQNFDKAFDAAKTYEPSQGDWLSSRWEGFFSPNKRSVIEYTGVTRELFNKVGKALYSIPDGFTLHRQLVKILDSKKDMIEGKQPIDWATAEALAFGTLIKEGNHVRLSGQDVERGTFSHRHAVLHDQNSNSTYTPLNYIDADQAKFVVCNSSLSEFGVLGFELGYSLEQPHQLVMWEAQFGDFNNGAQIMIDQFISSGEQKWKRQSGLVMLLPHGYDGQGPEHSSCRIERFLQMCDDDEDFFPEMDEGKRVQIQWANWQIVNCSTPANYFHVLRRQLHRQFRKPLVVATPKNLLRHKLCVSEINDFLTGTRFQRFFPENKENVDDPNKVRRLILCTGKIYYELLQAKLDKNIRDIAISRVEQISPFPFDYVEKESQRFPNAEIVWVQEEPKNMGCWSYVNPRIETSVQNTTKIRPRYIGQKASASPATGFAGAHKSTQEEILSKSFE